MSKAGRVPSARRQRRSPEEIMERLLAAAEEEFKASGYTGGTTAAIARRAGITEAQLFRYFPSKAALFRRAMVKPLDDHFHDFLARKVRGSTGAEGFQAEARAYISELQEFIGDHEKMFLSLVSADAYAHQNVEGVSGVDGLHEYFKHGAETLATRSTDHPVPAELMVRVSFAAVLACVIFREWLFPDDLAPDSELRKAVNHFVLYGIQGEPPGTQKGV